jgi:hypothetical protein
MPERTHVKHLSGPHNHGRGSKHSSLPAQSVNYTEKCFILLKHSSLSFKIFQITAKNVLWHKRSGFEYSLLQFLDVRKMDATESGSTTLAPKIFTLTAGAWLVFTPTKHFFIASTNRRLYYKTFYGCNCCRIVIS